MADKMWNGALIGAIMGFLIANTSISFIQSIITSITNLIPTAYQFQYISSILFAIIGALIGWYCDKV